MTDWLGTCFIVELIDWLTNYWTSGLTDRPTDRRTDWLTNRLAGWLADCWLADWLTGWLADWMNKWMNEWMNEWPNKPVNEWMIGLLNKDLPTDLPSPFHFILQPVTWVLQFLLTSLNLSTWKKRNTSLKMDRGRYDRCLVLSNLPLCIREDNRTIEIIFHLSICLFFYINLWGQI